MAHAVPVYFFGSLSRVSNLLKTPPPLVDFPDLGKNHPGCQLLVGSLGVWVYNDLNGILPVDTLAGEDIGEFTSRHRSSRRSRLSRRIRRSLCSRSSWSRRVCA